MLLKRLPYLLTCVFTLPAPAQSFPVKNVNYDYVITRIKDQNIPDYDWHRVLRDMNGVYWFQRVSELYSFDGVNWRPWKIRAANGALMDIRINDILVTDDNLCWLGTSEGMYVLDRATGNYVPAKQKFPHIRGWPRAVSCVYQSGGKLVFIPVGLPGFFLLDYNTVKLEHILLDEKEKIVIPHTTMPFATDNQGRVWGITASKKGLWSYDPATGKLRRSWKGELPEYKHTSLQEGITVVTFSEPWNTLWISYGPRRFLEGIDLTSGESRFFTFSFTGSLRIHGDTSLPLKERLLMFSPKTDRENNHWLNVSQPNRKFIVKLDRDLRRSEYLASDPVSFPLGTWNIFHPEKSVGLDEPKDNKILLWIFAQDKLSIIKKRPAVVRHIPYDTVSPSGIRPMDFENASGRINIFYVKDRRRQYFVLQQNPGRPKLISLDSSLQIRKALLADAWRKYPAYFNPDLSSDSFYIALMRPGEEPLDFRKVVVADFRVDLRTLTTEKLELNFRQRVWRYGQVDKKNVYWLYSHGQLFSYDPARDRLDSLFICNTSEKKPYDLEQVKAYDYPTVLHQGSSSFWINFVADREIYKINLESRRVEKIFTCCIDHTGCSIPGIVFDMYAFDSDHIVLHQPFGMLLLHTKTHSLTQVMELFSDKPRLGFIQGIGHSRDWVYIVMPEAVYFLNQVTGEQKRLVWQEDFKWPITQINSAPLVNDRGEMILPSSAGNGFLVFNPNELPSAPRPGNVRISFARLDDYNLLPDSLMNTGVLHLKFNGYNRLHLGFSDHTIYGQDKIRYDYALYKGGDTAWNRIRGIPEITFSDLSPGNYQLLVRAGNGLGGFSEKITSLRMVIIPPFWQQTWFMALCGILLLAIILVWAQARINEVRKKEKEKRRAVKQMAELELQSLRSQLNPHFMFNSLNAILELILLEDNEKAHTYLARFSKLLRMLLENTEKPFVSLNKEIDFLALYLSLEKLRVPELRFSLHVDPAVDANDTFIPNMVLQPYIENALWHGLSHKQGEKHIELNVYRKNGAILYEIRDNGVGRKKAEEYKSQFRREHKSKGMELLSKRFKLLSEEYGSEIETRISDVLHGEEVAGTMVQLKIPWHLGGNGRLVQEEGNGKIKQPSVYVSEENPANGKS